MSVSRLSVTTLIIALLSLILIYLFFNRSTSTKEMHADTVAQQDNTDIEVAKEHSVQPDPKQEVFPQETEKKITPPTTEKEKNAVLAPHKHDIVFGDPNAPVTIVEYASFSCSHCASFYKNTFSQLKSEYIDTGKVHFVYRHFPLDDPSLRGALLVHCSNDKTTREKLLHALFDTQSNWAHKQNFMEVLFTIGKLGGLNGDDIEACMQDESLSQAILETKFQALKILEIRSTPTFFINGQMHKGNRNFDYFQSAIHPFLPDATSSDTEGDTSAAPASVEE